MSISKSISAALIAAFCIGAPAIAQSKEIRKENEYRNIVIGKTLVYENGTRIDVKADGTMVGVSGSGEKIVGAWNWQRRFFCRNVNVGSNQLGSDCTVVEVDGNKIRNIRDRGRGEASPWATLE